MTQARYHLGVDLGTTYTAAAVVREGGSAHPEVVSLGAAAAAVPSVVFLPEDGSLVVGDAAQRRALTEPRRIAREFKRRIGDGTPLVVGGRAVPAEEIAARFVAWVVAEVEHREGGPAASVAVTHPAEWGEYKRSCLAGALAEHGLGDVTFLTEPQAAAVGYANAERIEPGSVVGVYDLGGGTFDAAVVRKLGDGGFEVLGRPTGLERLGGIDFDDRIFEHVRTAVDAQWRGLDPTDTAVQTAVAGLRRECTAAKEALSADTEVMVPVMLPGIHTQVRLGRTEFEDMIRPSVVETVEALQRAIVSADVRPADLAAVLLVGGSSRIPLVSQLVSAELGRAIAVDADPKTVIAAGAALAARGPSAPPEPAVVAEPAATDVPDAAPPSPPIAFDAPPGDDDVADPRRRRVLVLAASLAVTAACVLSASVAAGIGPVTIEEAAGELAAPGTALAAPALGTAVDSWTGEAPTATTTPGPVRPAAVSAPEPPRTRTVATGATGASRVTPAPKASAPKPKPGPVVAGPPVPPAPPPGPPLVEQEQPPQNNNQPPPPNNQQPPPPGDEQQPPPPDEEQPPPDEEQPPPDNEQPPPDNEQPPGDGEQPPTGDGTVGDGTPPVETSAAAAP